MNAAMCAQVYSLERYPGQGNGGFEHFGRVTGDRKYAAVMHCVAASIENARARAPDCSNRGIYRCRISTFGKVRHDLEDHQRGRASSIACAMSGAFAGETTRV
jgi:hypothetical protein